MHDNSAENDARFDNWGTGCGIWALSMVLSVGIGAMILRHGRQDHPFHIIFGSIAFGFFVAVSVLHGVSQSHSGTGFRIVVVCLLILGTPVAFVLLVLITCASSPWGN